MQCIVFIPSAVMLSEDTPEARSVTYLLTIISVTEMKKSVSKRQSVSGHLKLDSDEPWDTLKAQILVKISDALRPAKIDYADYNVIFHITCLVPKPGMALNDNYDCSFMLEQALKGKNAVVNLVVTGIAKEMESDKENERNSDDEESGTGKTSKKKVCADHMIMGISAESDFS